MSVEIGQKYSDLPADTINTVVNSFGLVMDELMGIINNPLSLYDYTQIIADIKNTKSEWCGLPNADVLSTILEDEYTDSGKIVCEYFKLMIPQSEDI